MILQGSLFENKIGTKKIAKSNLRMGVRAITGSKKMLEKRPNCYYAFGVEAEYDLFCK